jgi:hypothetical protein
MRMPFFSRPMPALSAKSCTARPVHHCAARSSPFDSERFRADQEKVRPKLIAVNQRILKSVQQNGRFCANVIGAEKALGDECLLRRPVRHRGATRH